jgi:hypothetical protein
MKVAPLVLDWLELTLREYHFELIEKLQSKLTSKSE